MFGLFKTNRLGTILKGLNSLVTDLEVLVSENERKADKTHDTVNVYRAKIAKKQQHIAALQEESTKALQVASNVRRLMGEDVG
jgi:hypothetical protein